MNNNPKYIVLGHQKTGTSAIASLLAEKGGLTKQIDLPGSGDCVKGKISLNQFIAKHPEYFCKTLIKEPEFTYIYDELVKHFPEAKFIFVVRHPLDNIRSILDRVNINPSKLPLTLDKIENLSIHNAWKQKLLGIAINDNNELNVPKTLSYRWKKAANIYLNNKENFYLIKYENFNSNKEKNIKILCKKLGIPEKNNISNKLNIQYQPKGKNRDKSLTTLFSKEIIKDIEEYCYEEIKKLNYKFYYKNRR